VATISRRWKVNIMIIVAVLFLIGIIVGIVLYFKKKNKSGIP
jgi:membrane protein YdbS with pleckstrin-like domain